MRPVGALLLALVLAGPAVLAQAPSPPAGPTLNFIKQPTYTPGDQWRYVLTTLGENNTLISTNQTLRVIGIGDWNGTPAYILNSASYSSTPAQPSDPTHRSVQDAGNKTTWLSVDGLRTLHIFDKTDELQTYLLGNSILYHESQTTRNWTFRAPQDTYRFPLIVDAQWTNTIDVHIHTNVTYYDTVVNRTSDQNNTIKSYGPDGDVDLRDTTDNRWLRVEQTPTGVGNITSAVVQTVEGNTTIFDSWAPSIGNHAERQIVQPPARGQNPVVTETLFLVDYRFQNAPAAPGPTPPLQQDALGGFVLPIAMVAGVGVIVGLAVVAGMKRRQARGGQGSGGAAPPAGPDAAPGPGAEPPERP
jgi:hypothetical protein